MFKELELARKLREEAKEGGGSPTLAGESFSRSGDSRAACEEEDAARPPITSSSTPVSVRTARNPTEEGNLLSMRMEEQGGRAVGSSTSCRWEGQVGAAADFMLRPVRGSML
eukprot:746131-Hanusia_phi.AAC.3